MHGISASSWNVPRSTHSYFLEQLLDCGISHIKAYIFVRYIKYHRSLRRSASMEVRVLANIVTTVST